MKTTRRSPPGIAYTAKSPLVRAGLLACLVAGIAFVAALLNWWPAHETNHELAEDVVKARGALEASRQGEELARAYARSSRDVPILEEKLKAAVNQAQMIEELGALANANGLRIAHQAYFQRRRDSGDELLVELAIEGPYLGVRDFVYGVAQLPVWLQVEDIQLANGDDADRVKGRLRLINVRLREAGAEVRT